MKKEVLIILLLLFVSFPAVASLLLPGGFTSHDLTHHVIRQIDMDRLLSEGQFPPRWSGDLGNGYGYPLFLFNYPLPALIGEVFHKAGFSFLYSVKAVLFSSMILSVLGMYLFLKSFLGSRLPAFLGAVFYLYAPLRFLNVYVAASVGSALALGILPFVFWSMVEIKKGKGWAALSGALSVSGLILAHNVTALIFAPVILTFAWVIAGKRAIMSASWQIGIMFILGLGLSAWFWLPALLEKQYTGFDLIFGGFYQDQFVSFWQLIRSPWGYGLSHPQNPEPGDMSYQLGLVHIGVMLVFVPFVWIKREIREIRVIGGLVLSLFLLSILLMLKVSLPLWERLPFLYLVQFPLRFQAISIFSAGIAAGLLVKYLPFRKIVFAILLVLVIYANRNHWNINEKFDPGEEYYLNLKTTSTTYGEHLPKWGKAMDKAARNKLEFVEGGGDIRIIKDQSAQVLAVVEATAASRLRFNQFYFPGWEITVDGKPTSFNYKLPSEDCNLAPLDYKIDCESYGLPVFDIAENKHEILAQFKNTTDRNLADAISLASVIVWLVLLCRLLILR